MLPTLFVSCLRLRSHKMPLFDLIRFLRSADLGRILLTLFLFGRPRTAQLASRRHIATYCTIFQCEQTRINRYIGDTTRRCRYQRVVKVVSGLDVLSNSDVCTSILTLLLTPCPLDSPFACQVNLISSTWTAVALGYFV